MSQLFKPSGVDGVYGRTGAYESVVEALAALISRHRPAKRRSVPLPAGDAARVSLEKQGYLKSFPNLIGAVSTLAGSEREIAKSAAKHEDGGDWTEDLKPADLVLAPAACYPIYPIAAERGVVPDAGYVFDVAADCFRHEPSRHVDRFQTLPHARICPHRHAGSRSRHSASPGSSAPRASPTPSACPIRSMSPTIPSSAGSAP